MFFIGADLGTSSVKMVLTDEKGEIIKTCMKSYTAHYPKTGWSEQNPEDWWTAFVAVAAELTKDVEAKQIGGISVAGQMHGLVAVDKNGAVIRPAILWNDSRAVEETAYLNEKIGTEKLAEFTGNMAFPGFTAPKLLWMQKNEPKKFQKIHKVLLPKDYINYRLTGVYATDFSDASGTLLLDVKNKCWSDEMLSICGLTESRLPDLFESTNKIGQVCAKELSFCGISVAAGAADNAAAAVGTGAAGGGKCNISVGTSGTVLVSSKNFILPVQRTLHAFCHADGGFYVMGCNLSAAACVKWFCEIILKNNDYAALESEITNEILEKNDVFFCLI